MSSGHVEQGRGDAKEGGQGQRTSNARSKNESVQRTLALLGASDDTSRFAGLTVLRALLDNNEEFQKDPKVMAQFWAAIPAKFLDRMLRAGGSGKKSKQEAESMVELAVGVLHAFIRLIPSIVQEDAKFVGRAEGLMAALAWSPEQSMTQILQLLVTIASTMQGSSALLAAKSWPQLLKAIPEHSLAIDVVKYTFLAAAHPSLDQSLYWDKLDGTLVTLVDSFKDTGDFTLFFECLNRILTASPPRENTLSPGWLVPTVELIRVAGLSRQAAKSRQALMLLTATLFHLYPSRVPQLIFDGAGKQISSSESKPVSYLFIKLLLIDIRSSVPSLLAILNSPEYPSTSARIAGSYDIIASFIGFLVQSLDDEDEDGMDVGLSARCSLSPSLLLKLRADISEVMSLTIEALRDRFDAAIAGAAGLEPSARLHSAGPNNPSRAISWESSQGGMIEDPLTLSQLRALALWLREDDNDALRREAAGVTDVLLYLYGSDGKIGFHSPTLIALEGIITVPEGVEAFLRTGGWEALVKDLRELLASPRSDSLHDTEIVRVLLGIVEADETGPAKEEWMEVVQLASTTEPWNQRVSLELATAVAQLAVEIVGRSPSGVRKRNRKAVDDLAKWSKDISRSGLATTDEARDAVQEIMHALEDLGFAETESNWSLRLLWNQADAEYLLSPNSGTTATVLL